MKSFWRLLSYIKNYKRNVTLSIASNVLTAIFTALSIPLFIPFLNILFGQEDLLLEKPEFAYKISSIAALAKYHISVLLVEDREKALIVVCLSILIVFFLKNLFRYLSLYFMAPVRNGIMKDMRGRLFHKIVNLPLAYFSEEKKGDLMSRMTSDVQEVEWSILNVLVAIFREPLILMSALGLMLYFSPGLTLFVFGLMIFTGVVIGGLGRNLRKSSNVIQQTLGNLLSITEEGLSGLRIIKGFNAQPYNEEKFLQTNTTYTNLLTKLLRRRDLASPLSEFLGIATVLVLLWYGSRYVFAGDMKPADFLTFIMAFYYMIEPSKALNKAFYNIQKGMGALERLEKIWDAPEVIKEIDAPKLIHNFDKGITYENVSFSYTQNEEQVLSLINLKVPKGKTIALVGPSGAGKTTLLDLLPRFYDIENGTITIDDTNIKDLSLKSLRAQMGIVSQEAILFNDSVYNNIVFGQECKEEDVYAAAQMANAHEFIDQLKDGYQTNIGDRGNKLSGGQRQRLTIARAILKNPPILLLDEATSALDAESEKLVQQALNRLMENRTSIVIAHRLSTIRHADEIIVMEHGCIVERGRHEDLIKLGGVYKKMVDLQAFGE